jgi:NAD(P)-dependent dehydrogenase (short-subunit alcohol dehydrogenase family)
MPRRVPVPQLRPALELCKPTDVTLDREQPRRGHDGPNGGVGKSLVVRLEKRGVTPLVLEPSTATDTLEAQLANWLAEGSIQGVYWLPALDVEPTIEEMTLDEWRELNRVRVKNLYTTMRTLYDSVYASGTFLISATRFGGQHGYGEAAATAPMGGAVCGFTKAFNVEQGMRDGLPLVKVVDFEVSRKTAEPADQLIAETLSDPGIVEIGYKDGDRFAVTLVETPAADGQPGMDLNEETVFVVTGAAGGITSAIVTDLALASKGVFYLLDLVEAPARDDENVLLFRSDVNALKSKLIAEARDRGERPTPVAIDKEIMAIERSEAALRAIETVEQAGGTAFYHSVNLMDGDAVTAIVDDIRERYGRIDVLLHAGGLLIDRTLPNKEPGQFNLVFDVKADGFFSLVNAAKRLPIGATVSFSSVAGRFGNNGQSDYSSANDLLCKISSSMRSWRPETRGIAIDWTAWGEIGMASRGSVPAIMEALGIDMLPPESGVPTIRRELTYGGTRGEILVAGRLGAWVEEKDENGGLDTEKVNALLAEKEHPLAMLGEVKAAKLYGGLIVETELDPTVEPYLYDHKVEPDVAWLPGVMGTESMVQAASLLTPGYDVVAVENQTNLGAFKFHRDKPQTMRLTVNIIAGAADELLADVLLQSIFQPPRPELPPQIKDHFAATVRLAKASSEGAKSELPSVEFAIPSDDELSIEADGIYEVFFHGPAYQVIERAKVAGNAVVSLVSVGLIPNAADENAAELSAPRLFEHMVQAPALWSVKTNGAMALPAGFVKATLYRQPSEANGQRLYALTEAVDGGERFNVTMVDESGNVYATLEGYQTVQMK